MLPIERQQQILSWVKEEGALRVSELSSRLGVSEMTVYRDIKLLLKDEKVNKTSNGIEFVSSKPTFSPNRCVICFKTVQTRFAVQLIMADQRVEQACCAHCGLLRYKDVSEQVSQIICKDFLLDTTISAKSASFLVQADIDIQCCKPQVLTFESGERAIQFQKGFGGNIYSFDEVIHVLTRDMNTCCSKK